MAHFYGTVRGSKGDASRTGGKCMSTVAASYQGSVRVDLYRAEECDMARVYLDTWSGEGCYRVLYEGPINPEKPGAPAGQVDPLGALGKAVAWLRRVSVSATTKAAQGDNLDALADVLRAARVTR